MQIWRISNHPDLTGRGGMLVDGRWHRRGVPIVYCTDHPSTALLEVLVHMDRDAIPDTYQLIEIRIPDSLSVTDMTPPPGWEWNFQLTQEIGMTFLKERNAALLRIPSVVIPKTHNLLLNPLHPDAGQISVAGTINYPFDSRLLK